MDMQPIELLGPTDAARELKVSRSMIHHWVKEGLLRPTLKVKGNRLLFSRVHLQEFAESRNKKVA